MRTTALPTSATITVRRARLRKYLFNRDNYFPLNLFYKRE